MFRSRSCVAVAATLRRPSETRKAPLCRASVRADHGSDASLGAGQDALSGGHDLDTLKGGTGGDELNGGVGFDIVSCFHSTERVFVDIDEQTGVDGGHHQAVVPPGRRPGPRQPVVQDRFRRPGRRARQGPDPRFAQL